MRTKSVVVVTGATPYLGGLSTWLPLRRAAPDLTFIDVDTLNYADSSDVTADCRKAIFFAARDADCVLAHHTAAKVAIEAVAQMARVIPVLLVSPVLVRRRTPLLSGLRSIIKTRACGQALTSFARSKRVRLLSDRRFLMKQMLLLVDEAHISDSIVQEALLRIADPRTAWAVERTAETLLEIINPIDSTVDSKVQRRAVILGTSRVDRKTATRTPARILPHARGAAMIEAPQTVVRALRDML